jgi:nucleoside-diphosphate-sugar epimerase
MKIAITGSNGFIGSALKETCIQEGIETIGLCRNPTANDTLFDLNDPMTFKNIPNDVTALVHAAYATQAKDLKKSSQANIKGSKSLFDFCHKAHIPIIFLSSCSAHENARSFYGRSKYQLEKHLLATDTIVRPGFVIGDGGIYKRLENSIKTLKFAPLFWGGQQHLQIVHLDELVQGIITVIKKKLSGAYTLAHPTPYPIKDFYALIFKKLGLKPRFVKLPGDLVLVALKIAGALRIPLPLTSENLFGLKYPMVFESDCVKLGIEPKDFA